MYLRELPEPLLKFELYSEWLKAAGLADVVVGGAQGNLGSADVVVGGAQGNLGSANGVVGGAQGNLGIMWWVGGAQGNLGIMWWVGGAQGNLERGGLLVRDQSSGRILQLASSVVCPKYTAYSTAPPISCLPSLASHLLSPISCLLSLVSGLETSMNDCKPYGK